MSELKNIQKIIDEIFSIVDLDYKHYEINRMTSKAKRIVSDLFKIYSQEADCLPNEWKLNYDKAENSFSRNRIITDYIAGMTDRFAINEHKKLYDFNKGW